MTSPPSKKRKVHFDLKISDLHDTCLIQIFNKLSNVTDFVAIYKASKRFKTAAEVSFQQNFKAMNVSERKSYPTLRDPAPKSPLEYFCSNKEKMTYETLTKTIQHFGKDIKDFSLYCEIHKSDAKLKRESKVVDILQLISKHCDGLKGLSLERVEIDKMKIVGLNGLIRRLEKFKFEYIDDATLTNCLHYGDNLKELIVRGTKNMDNIVFVKKFKNLEKFGFILDPGDRHIPKNLKVFVESHPSLKFINVNVPVPSMATADYLHYMNNVETLVISLTSTPKSRQDEIDWIGLMQLENLKALSIRLFNDISKTIKKVKSKPVTKIEILDAYGFEEVCDLLNVFNFAGLKKLAICGSQFKASSMRMSVALVTSLSENIKHVEEFKFFCFTKYHVKYILEFVKNAESLKVLRLSPDYEEAFSVKDILQLVKIQNASKRQFVVNYCPDAMKEAVTEAIKLNEQDSKTRLDFSKLVKITVFDGPNGFIEVY